MSVRRLTFTRGATLNLGNYNNARIEFSAEIEVKEGEDPDAAYEKLREWVEGKVKAEVGKFRSAR